MRNISKVVCKLCEKSFLTTGMGTHLKNAHDMTTSEYASQYGEFRKKYIHDNGIEKRIECKICSQMFSSDRKLTYHLYKYHSTTRVDYTISYVFDGKIPTCACGCGNAISIHEKYPYYSTYISGHNPNPMLGKKHTADSISKMSKSATERITTYRNSGSKAPMHQRKYVLERVYGSIDEYMQILSNSGSSLLSSYDDIVNDSVDLHFKCNLCGIGVYQKSLQFICSNCIKVKSKEQVDLTEYIKSLGFDVVENSRKILNNGLELDIFIPSKNIAIEYNGLYWHSENLGHKSKTYHLNKLNSCKDAGIRLISIFSDEWIDNNELVKRKLCHILGVSQAKRIHARKCIIKEIPANIKGEFLNKYHIQGNDKSKIKLGAFYDDILVAVMTFSNMRISLGSKPTDGSFELIRFAVNYDYIVSGIGSRLLNYFATRYSPGKIVSYADLRWSDNNISNFYTKSGFVISGISRPNYWYTYRYKSRMHRFNFTKKSLVNCGYDSSMSEWEIMKNIGYDRVWDCGNIRYEYINNR